MTPTKSSSKFCRKLTVRRTQLIPGRVRTRRDRWRMLSEKVSTMVGGLGKSTPSKPFTVKALCLAVVSDEELDELLKER